MVYNVFVDGQYGTTGLKINEYLSRHPKVKVMDIEYGLRRDIETRKKYMNAADIVFLCLPDDAVKHAVALVENTHTKIIDASSVHRTNEQWTYGMPELAYDQREKIKNSSRVTVPGCHATATILALTPLVKENIIPPDYPISITSVTGYSGGGKELIDKYEDQQNEYLKVPRPYALTLNHKHLPEIKKYAGLSQEPILQPIVSNYYKGLAVSIPLYTNRLKKCNTPGEICTFLSKYYQHERFIKVMPYGDESLLLEGGLDITACNNTNIAEILVFGNEHRITIITRLDNLGKGASAAAVQNMNIMLGIHEETGLV